MRKRILTIISLIVLTICIFPVFAFGGTGAVRLNYVKPGISFKIYKIGDFNSSGVFAVDEDFSAYGIDFESSEAAQTLAAYVERDDIAEEGQASTGSDNTVVFSGLESGYYLILGETYNDGDYIYTALPVMLTVYEGEVIEISGKYEMADISDNGGDYDYQSVSALKVWSGGSLDSIVVQLLCDGEVYDEQALNSSNNWRYTWDGLDLVLSLTDTEKEIPSCYSLSIENDGKVFILLNTKDSDTPGGGEDVTETSTEVTTDAKTETTTKKPSGGGGGSSVYPNETETTTEESVETTTESGYEQGTEEEEAEETTENKNDSSDDDDNDDNDDNDDDEDNSGSDDSPEPVTDENGKVISESQVGDDSGTGTDSSASSSSASVSSESGEASAASVSSNSEGGASVSSGSSAKLPQTGQLWYPVPI
ncbi:MAG: Cna B-type domain-containing protein, partial [Clostridiales bacterium]|nr:Cna B-type domain-containing protein [Clostridiales bacterium]